MSLSSLSNFTILIKKMARKSTLARKITTKKQRSARTRRHTTTAAHDQDLASVSTYSSNEDEKHPVNVPATTTMLNSDSKIDHLVTAAMVSSQIVEDEINHSTTLTTMTSSDIVSTTPVYQLGDTENQPTDDTSSNSDDSSNWSSGPPDVIIRDFAYPDSSPLHHGQLIESPSHDGSRVSLSSSRFNGCQAKALYDFIPETDYEIAMKSGQTIWIQYRQCAGWLIADVDDETGLVPESYIELI